MDLHWSPSEVPEIARLLIPAGAEIPAGTDRERGRHPHGEVTLLPSWPPHH